METKCRERKILIVNEAIPPQINGVVRTYQATIKELKRLGHEVLEISPDLDRVLTFDSPEAHVYLEFFAQSRLTGLINEFKPTRRHIATKGLWAGRRAKFS